MTTIKPSLRKNAGNGLFTTKSYKKGEYICYYDGIEKKIESFQCLHTLSFDCFYFQFATRKKLL